MSSRERSEYNDILQLLPRHRYMLQRVDVAFGIYDENVTEVMFLQHDIIGKVKSTK